MILTAFDNNSGESLWVAGGQSYPEALANLAANLIGLMPTVTIIQGNYQPGQFRLEAGEVVRVDDN